LVKHGDVIGGFTADGHCAGIVEVTEMPFAVNLNALDFEAAEKIWQ